MQTRELCSGNVLQEGAAGTSSLVCTGLYGRRVSAEPHPHQSTRTRELQCALLQFLYIWGKQPHFLPCGSISPTLTRFGLVLVPSLFRFSAVVNLHFSFPNSASVLSSCYFWYLLTWNCLQLKFTANDLFTARVHMKAVLTSLNMAFLPISWSRFKQP